jgi:hypothetical protein
VGGFNRPLVRLGKSLVPFLKENGLERTGWKQSDFGAAYEGRHGAYRDWSEAQWLLARNRLCEILGASALFGVGCAVVRRDYEEILALHKYNLPSDLYEFCLDRCLSVVSHRLHELPHDEGIAIYCDQSKEQEPVGQALAQWHSQYVTLYADARYRQRPVTTKYGSRKDFIPLQATDIIATEAYRACGAFVEGMPRQEIDNRYPIIRRLRDNGSLPNILLYSKNFLLSDLKHGFVSPVRYGEKL